MEPSDPLDERIARGTPRGPEHRTSDVRLLLGITLLGVLAAAFGGGERTPAPPPRLPAHRIDLIRCSEGELQAVPGVGPVLAARIAAARRRRPLRTHADLLAVPGLGPVLVGRLLRHGRLSGRAPPEDGAPGEVSAAGAAPLAR